MKFKVGTIVHHRASDGKTPMLITYVAKTSNLYDCRWIDKNGVKQESTFSEYELFQYV